MHYGIKRKSGRYPWGSGDRPFQSEPRKSGGIKNYSSPTKEFLKQRAKHYAIAAGIGAIGVVTHMYVPMVAAYSLWGLYNTSKYHFDNKDYTKRENTVGKISDLNRKIKDTSIEEDMKLVNPRVGEQAGRVNNCSNCALAMEMRQRGYDVIARSSGRGHTLAEINDCFKKVDYAGIVHYIDREGRDDGESRKHYLNRMYRIMNTEMGKLEGKRGIFSLDYEDFDGGTSFAGHVFNFEVKNGKVKFYDGQTSSTNLDKILSISDPMSWYWLVTNDLEINDNVTKFVTNRERG